MTRALRYAVLMAGLTLGAFSLAVARGEAGNSFGGSSAFAGAAELAAGYALLAVGIAAWMRPRQARLGAIMVAASFAWFLLEWNNPAVWASRSATPARCSCSACSPPLSSIPRPGTVRSARATCCWSAAAARTGASTGPGCTWV